MLGFAFAAADLLIEVDSGGRVTYALGAGPVPGNDPGETWIGTRLADWLEPASARDFRSVMESIAPGQRTAAQALLVRCGDGRVRPARVRAFQLPEAAPLVSCALSWDGGAARPVTQTILDADGLLSRVRGLMSDVTRVGDLDVAFVVVPGLDADGPVHDRAGARIEAALQAASLDGTSAARLGADRFALVRSPDAAADLRQEVRDAAVAEGLSLEPDLVEERLANADAALVVRTLRLALDGCVRDGVGGAKLGERLRRAVTDAERFRGIVRARNFLLHYQPIVDLGSREAHHFEALTRFGAASPAPAIRMAEELNLIEGFDLAVAEKALRRLATPGFGQMTVAINASAASLAEDSYVEGLLDLTRPTPELRRRLMVEITETAAVSDLDGAARRLKVLRDAGIRICLDDFGAGSASFEYLRRLPIDLVKIDGGFVRDLEDDRSQTLIRHLVQLCADLKLSTVGEMVETEDQARTLKALGVSYGQGWLFGRPAADPVLPAAGVRPAARRRVGEVASWS
jgi:EAL domain-containing protein (putative c-di-GMP-specific phosphodiesterase class I)